jgi:hypothetical protein
MRGVGRLAFVLAGQPLWDDNPRDQASIVKLSGLHHF